MERSKNSDTSQIEDPDKVNISPEELTNVCASTDNKFNYNLANQVGGSVYPLGSDPKIRQIQYRAAISGMAALQPTDAIEGMLAAQMVATHNAVMECYRRARFDGLEFEVWREYLNQASKLGRSFTSLVETLNRHRGKGRQHVIVERVDVHRGGQAIVGAVSQADGRAGKEEEPSHAPQALTYEPGIPLRSPYSERDALPVPSGEGEDSL